MAQHWNRDPKNGDYVMVGGAPQQTDSLTIPAFHRMKTKRKTWLYAPDDNYGSDFHLIDKRRTTEDASFVENIGAAALTPIVDDGRSSGIEINTIAVARHGIGLETKITDASGNVQRLVLPSI